MFETGIFPDSLKIARICPIHKGGAEGDISNYRPISVLPVLSKVFEGAINIRLEKFFAKYGVISDMQFGFQKGKSTEDALLSIKHDIIHNFEHRLYTLGLFVDLRKAFDSVCHDVLLIKLKRYGVRGVVLKLIESYLSNRLQYVSVHQGTTTKIVIKQGVPQGSILGPLLFLVYINDLCSIYNSPKLIMYADDTNIFFTARTLTELQEIVNKYMESLSDWLHANRLQLNTNKTKYIIFAPINKPMKNDIHITFRGTPLKQEVKQKFLGVWFQENLSWNTHIDNLALELSRSLGCLYRISSLIPLWLKVSLYYTLFYSRLSYCILVWGTTSSRNYLRILKFQKRVLRLLERYAGHPQDLPTGPLFVKYSLLRADEIYCFKLLQYVQKHKLHAFSNPAETHTLALRRQERRKPRTRTNYGKQHLNYQIPVLLNKLPDDVDLNKSIKKKHSKQWLSRKKFATSDISFKTICSVCL